VADETPLTVIELHYLGALGLPASTLPCQASHRFCGALASADHAWVAALKPVVARRRKEANA
jgi:hypothetical protein